MVNAVSYCAAKSAAGCKSGNLPGNLQCLPISADNLAASCIDVGHKANLTPRLSALAPRMPVAAVERTGSNMLSKKACDDVLQLLHCWQL